MEVSCDRLEHHPPLVSTTLDDCIKNKPRLMFLHKQETKLLVVFLSRGIITREHLSKSQNAPKPSLKYRQT